jgi:hypothetical protein
MREQIDDSGDNYMEDSNNELKERLLEPVPPADCGDADERDP